MYSNFKGNTVESIIVVASVSNPDPGGLKRAKKEAKKHIQTADNYCSHKKDKKQYNWYKFMDSHTFSKLDPDTHSLMRILTRIKLMRIRNTFFRRLLRRRSQWDREIGIKETAESEPCKQLPRTSRRFRSHIRNGSSPCESGGSVWRKEPRVENLVNLLYNYLRDFVTP
jgi:primase-polymerase (primpol)-like protein